VATVECPYCYAELIVNSCDTIECPSCESTLSIDVDEDGNFIVQEN